jgi:hypothetical protein
MIRMRETREQLERQAAQLVRDVALASDPETRRALWSLAVHLKAKAKDARSGVTVTSISRVMPTEISSRAIKAGFRGAFHSRFAH